MTLSLVIHCSFFGIFWKCARVGERLSPYVGLCCIAMAVSRRDHPVTQNSFDVSVLTGDETIADIPFLRTVTSED